MIIALLLFAQAPAGIPPASVPSAQSDVAPSTASKKKPPTLPGDEIVVTSRTGEHPARLGTSLPEVAGPKLPMAVIDLGNGATLSSEGRTHAREGGEEIHFTVKVPF